MMQTSSMAQLDEGLSHVMFRSITPVLLTSSMAVLTKLASSRIKNHNF